MAYVFYILQLLCPSYHTIGLQAPVEAYKPPYYYRNSTVAFKTEMDYRRAVECLSLSMYHEARSKEEGRTGMLLTGLVILNRVRHNDYPDDVCSVVYAPRSFSWTKDGKSDKPKEIGSYQIAQSLAKELLSGRHSSKLPSTVLYFKQCSYASEFFSKLRMYTRHKSHCYYYQPRKKK